MLQTEFTVSKRLLSAPEKAEKKPKKWALYVLILIALLSFVLNFWEISRFGYGNAYYAAAIKSMMQNFHNFFFVSFDPAGVVSVDKPPIALWIQTLFVLAFGYHGWAMLLPQALAGTGCTIMIYILLAKRFGQPTGLIAALVFSLTPSVIVAARNNTMDLQLILILLVVTWAFFHALETGKARFIVLAAILVGVGFNIKMLEAYLILPAMAIVFILFSKRRIKKRFLALIVCIPIILVVSFSWSFTVDHIPAANRPYVGSSSNNTELQLILGHNGGERLFGYSGGLQLSAVSSAQPPNQPTIKVHPKGSIAYLMQGGYTSNGNGNDTGNGGPFRLWGLSMFGQASWLLIFAFLSVIACIPRFKREKWSIRNGVLAFFLLWLITDFVFFSFSNFFHRYYLCVLAPPIAVLIGMGLPEMVQAFKEKRKWFGWLLPLSLLVTSIMSILFILHYPILRLFLVPIIALFTVISLLFLFLYRRKEKQGYLPPAIACTLAAILTAPFYWCLTVIWFPPVNSTMPYAGPELATQVQTRSMTSNQETMVAPDASTKAMEDYLVKNYQPGSFLVVTSRSDNAAAFIIDTGLPAVAYGGFVGTDKGLTLSEIKNLVNSGKITYFLLAEETGPGEFSNFSISAYVKTNAKLISPSEYGCGNMISSLNGTASFSLYRFNK